MAKSKVVERVKSNLKHDIRAKQLYLELIERLDKKKCYKMSVDLQRIDYNKQDGVYKKNLENQTMLVKLINISVTSMRFEVLASDNFKDRWYTTDFEVGTSRRGRRKDTFSVRYEYLTAVTTSITEIAKEDIALFLGRNFVNPKIRQLLEE